MDKKLLYSIEDKKDLKSLTLKEVIFLKEATDDIATMGKEHIFGWEDYNKYIFYIDNIGNVLGLLVYYITDTDDVYISKIYTTFKTRRRKVATHLVNKLRELYKDKIISLGVNIDNKASKEFFKSLGYKATAIYYKQEK